MTLLTTLLDFSNTGILDIFIDEAVRQAARDDARARQAPPAAALLKGQELATTFSFLRPNDLVWNYVVGNYLKGEAPPPSTCCTGTATAPTCRGRCTAGTCATPTSRTSSCKPGKADGLRRAGRPAQRSRRRSTSTPRARTTSCPGRRPTSARRRLSGKKRFVLGASGHIAGVINPPAKKKRNYWTSTAALLPATAEAWLAGAHGSTRQLVARLVRLARSHCRQAGRRAARRRATASTSRSSRRRAATSRQKA